MTSGREKEQEKEKMNSKKTGMKRVHPGNEEGCEAKYLIREKKR